MATAGSKEARQLEKVKKTFQEVYRESTNKIREVGGDVENGNIRYSFSNSESSMANDALISYDKELTHFIEERGDYIVDSFEKMQQIVNLAFDEPQRKATAYFGIINADTLEKIKNSVPNLPKEGKETLFKPGRDYSIATTLDSIRHIVDEKTLNREDVINYLDRLADTILEFDTVAFSFYEKGKEKLPGLLFKKRFSDGTLVSFNLISHKKRSLNLQTLYMDGADYQKKRSAETMLMQNAHSNTSKTLVGQTSDEIISHPNEKVNTFDEKIQKNSLSFEDEAPTRIRGGISGEDVA